MSVASEYKVETAMILQGKYKSGKLFSWLSGTGLQEKKNGEVTLRGAGFWNSPKWAEITKEVAAGSHQLMSRHRWAVFALLKNSVSTI